jgi:hypothetical protein
LNPKWVSRLAWGVTLVTVALALATAGLILAAWDGVSPPDRASFAFMFVLLPFYLAVGQIVLHYRPENRIGWLFLAVSFFFTVSAFTREYALYGYQTSAWPGVRLAAWLSLFVNASFFLWFILLNLLYPDGRFVSPAWRWLGWLTLAASVVLLLQEFVRPGFMTLYRWESSATLPITNPTGFIWLHELFERTEGLSWILSLLCLVASGYAPVQRYRRGRGVEKQQIKLLAYFWAITLVAIGLAILTQFFSVYFMDQYGEFIMSALFIGLIASFPIVVALGVFRYRLYEIDLIIRRTLIYGVLSAALAIVYAGSVVVLQEMFRTFSGSPGQSQLAIVISTLAVAALFSPLRRRVQEQIDRRFFRSRYDAERIVDAFAETARRETDLEALTGKLVEAVQSSLQPESLSIWLKGMKRKGTG